MEQNGYLLSGEAPQGVLEGSLPPPAALKPIKPRFEIHAHDRLFAWLCLPLGFLLTRYVLAGTDGYAATAVFLLMHLLSAVYIRKAGCKPQLSHRILGAVLCLFSTVFSITASAKLHGLCFLFLSAGELWRVHAVCGEIPFVTRWFPADLLAVVGQPFGKLGAAPAAMADSAKNSKSMKSAKTVILSLLITIPLTVIVASLLASADSGMEALFDKIGRLFTVDCTELLVQMIVGIPVGFWLFGAWYGGAKRKETGFRSDADYREAAEAFRVIPNLGIYAGITPICLMYLAYICSQMRYFCSAFAGRLPENMSYSEYARRGFFELCLIAVINLIVILVINGCAKEGGEKRPKMLNLYVTFLCGCTLFIIATAIAKMVLYIDAYGLTSQRLFTTWFMVLLAVVFICLIVRQFMQKFPTAAVIVMSGIVMFGGLCFSRPDALIAEYNITRYEQGTLKDLDIYALAKLSDDAFVVMMQHIDTIEAAGKMKLFRSEAYAAKRNAEKDNFGTWNLSTASFLSAYEEYCRMEEQTDNE